jgi:type IV pilus assembly protein PilB
MSNKKDAEEEMARSLSMRFGVPSIDLGTILLDRALIADVPYDLARRHELLPIRRDGAALVVAMSNPSNGPARSALAQSTGLTIQVLVAPRSILVRTIERFYLAN